MDHAPELEPVLLPLDDADGRYANFVDVWETAHDVTIDLYTLGSIDAEEGLRVATGVVRVRLPRTIIFEMITRLNRSLGPLEEPHG
jgi:hypothetical protein